MGSEGATRIPAHDERLRVGLAVDSQTNRIGAVVNGGAAAASTAAGAAAPSPAGRRRTQIPQPAMQARGRGQRLALGCPYSLHVERIRIARRRTIVARVAPHD